MVRIYRRKECKPCKICGIATKNKYFCSLRCRGISIQGENNPSKRPEVAKKISLGNIGRHHSEKTRHNMSLSRKGRKPTEMALNSLKAAGNKRRQVTLESRPNCQVCGKKVRGAKNKFCSRGCFGKTKIGNTCAKGYKTSDKQREICKIRFWERRRNGEIFGFVKGMIPWNKGLTKETDSRIKSIPISEEHKRAIRESKIGKARTEETKKRLSISMVEAYLNGSLVPPVKASYGIKSKYWSAYQNKVVTFRSSYEKKYAEWLDKNDIIWEYESRRFSLGKTTYCPDFHLIDSDEWVEVKGYWLPTAREKFELFKQMYPNIQIKVIDFSFIRKI